jgi:small subunit ribosomal protein S14
MKNKNRHDKAKRQLFLKYEAARMHYKAMHSDLRLPERVRARAMQKLAQLPRNSSRTRLRNRCVLTGRSGAVYSDFRLSRLAFRRLAAQGSLPGIYPASW